METETVVSVNVVVEVLASVSRVLGNVHWL